ncbi:MAG: hypothetical protein MUQ00_06495 [Candidatus Aminicenantes bacterium]|nr:hypothetical protein [Candidatus Aminicenantes bacterium]
MLTTNTTKVRAKEDDGKRRVITTTNIKPAKVRFMQTDFPGVQKRETNKIDPSAKFNTTELDHLMKTIGYKPVVKAERAPAPAIKTPQPKPAKKTTVKKRKAK